MRATLALTAMGLLLGACSQVPPDTAAPGDFTSYELQRAQREAALTGAPTGTLTGTLAGGLPPPQLVAAAPLAAAPVPPGGIPPSDLAAAGIGVAAVTAAPLSAEALAIPPAPLAPPQGAVLAVASSDPAASVGAGTSVASATSAAMSTVAGDVLLGSRAGGVEASPANAAPVLTGEPTAPATSSTGISDEQDFEAVASRESIESDAARRAQQAAQYQVIQPQALPTPPADTGPNIVEYALAAPNSVGQDWYSRFAFSGDGRAARNCGDYSGPDEAQRDFLARGGPERDPKGLDPDGDGFACSWDPAPFRAAVGR